MDLLNSNQNAPSLPVLSPPCPNGSLASMLAQRWMQQPASQQCAGGSAELLEILIMFSLMIKAWSSPSTSGVSERARTKAHSEIPFRGMNATKCGAASRIGPGPLRGSLTPPRPAFGSACALQRRLAWEARRRRSIVARSLAGSGLGCASGSPWLWGASGRMAGAAGMLASSLADMR